MTLTTNEKDFLAVLAWITTAKSLPPMVDAALQRLQAQLAQPDDAGSGARIRAEQDRLEALKGPRSGNGMVMAPPDPNAQSDAAQRAAFLERAKKPMLPPRGDAA